MDDLDALRARYDAVLSHLMADGHFAVSERGKDILRYVIEEELAGRGERIKAYSIATEALGRAADFDPQNDSIVRVEASKLRAALDVYFKIHGPIAGATLAIPKGGYRPALSAQEDAPREARAFSSLPEVKALESAAVDVAVSGRGRGRGRGSSSTSRAATSRVRISHETFALLLGSLALLISIGLAVSWWMGARESADPSGQQAGLVAAGHRPDLPRILFTMHGGEAGAAASRILLSYVAQFGTVITLADKPDGWGYPEDYVLELATLGAALLPRATVTVSHERSGEVVEARQIEFMRGWGLGRDTNDALKQIALNLAPDRGKLHRHYAQKGDVSPLMRCVFLIEAYWPDQTPKRHLEAVRCLDDYLEQYPDTPRALSLLGMMYREEYTDGHNPLPGNALARSLDLGRRALLMEPRNATLYGEHLGTLYLSGDRAQFIQLGERMVALNPLDIDNLESFAARLNYMGRHERALELFTQAEALEPVGQGWRAYGFFLAHLGLGQREKAAARIASLSGSKNPLYLAAVAMAENWAGNRAGAQDRLAQAAAADPGFAGDFREPYERRRYDGALVDLLSAQLRLIGTQR
ncbi:MAG: hypothetical protein MRY63_09610 [Neomegalonema sp.]|nr:hypothetical protein [Neomegalonema sp.]